QEAGRAGRDEKRSFAVLLFNASDKIGVEKKIRQNFPSYEEVLQVYDALGNFFRLAVGAGQGESYEFDIATFCSNFKFSVSKAFTSLRLLEQHDLISVSESVYMPSRVRVLVSREDLYKFQIVNPKADTFIKLLLRIAPGIMDDYVKIRESD